MIQRSILVCDPDPAMQAQLTIPMPNVSFIGAKTPTEAQHIIADRKNRLSSICINASVCDPLAIPLVRFSRSYRPATPIHFLLDSDQVLPEGIDMDALTVQKMIRKPVTAQQLVDQIIPSTTFDMEKALEVGKADTVAAGSEAEIDDTGLHPIEADSFLCGSKSFFDVYVRLSPKKYVKILKAQVAFDPEWVGSFLRKGVRYFYIRKEAHVFFLQYCDRLTDVILKKSDISIEVKQQQVQNFGRETFEFLKTRGISETTLVSAQRFVEFSHRLTSELQLKHAGKVAQLIEGLRTSEHVSGTVMIVSMILGALDFRDENVMETIALGAYLHDIGLGLLPNDLGQQDYLDLSIEDTETYEQHPLLGANALMVVPNLSPLVVQIVQQHHERRNRKGYPAKLGAGAIAPVAEITGIADTFHRMIERSLKDETVKPLDQIQRHFDEFSFQTVDGFRKAFLNGNA